MKIVRVALCQINPTVGDLQGNREKILSFLRTAREYAPDLIVFPELAVTGYPPEDLLLRPQFIKDNRSSLDEIKGHVKKEVVVVGFVDMQQDIYNAAAILYNGEVVDIYRKTFLPNYGVFDESRYFRAGARAPVYQLGESTFGVSICEDIWYPEGPVRDQALAGAEFVVNINASPYHIGKQALREKMLSTRAYDNGVIVAYLNTVGGQDELVFDGTSMVVDQNAEIIAAGRRFEEDLLVIDLDLEAVFMRRLHQPLRRRIAEHAPRTAERIVIDDAYKPYSPRKSFPERTYGPPMLSKEEEVYTALSLGTRDYIQKNGFKKVCIGLSGGIDSALVAAIAVDAIGREQVTGVFMPSPFTSQESRDDVYALGENLGIKVIEIPISEIYESYLKTLKPSFNNLPFNETEENIQARVRGNLLMAFSNKFGWLVLTTGNKSEMSVGYATLYGDMAGGFAVIKDIPKTLVYRIAMWRNTRDVQHVIPERILTKAPTAELRLGQKDTDTLPPYEVLDPILKAYVEEDRDFDEILSFGCGAGELKRVVRMVDKSEYKRRQSPPGIKITARAFGRDRRFPITNRYRSWE